MILDAAIQLFVKDGFDETNIDHVAEAAGISRRSFFRYFASKDDLLGQEILIYGIALSKTILDCPKSYSPMQVLRETVTQQAASTEAEPLARLTLQITEQSAAARQAQSSRVPEALECVAAAYAKRLRASAKDDVKAQLLATLTFSIFNVAVGTWYRDGCKDLPGAMKHTLATFRDLLSDPGFISAPDSQPSVAKPSLRTGEKNRTTSQKRRD